MTNSAQLGDKMAILSPFDMPEFESTEANLAAKTFNSENLIIKNDLDILNNFEISTQYIFFITHGGCMQWFLAKWDKACMSSAVEVRAPFLDKNLFLYSLALPLEKKIKNGRFKSILRDSMESFLPNEIVVVAHSPTPSSVNITASSKGEQKKALAAWL